MNVLIIGSKGFIGLHCVEYFSKKYKVWECDVILEYGNPNYYWVDALNPDYASIFEQNRFDVCINCSGAASVPESLKNPQKDFLLNAVNVYRLLDGIRRFSPECKFINLSSAAVYGDPESLPVTENQALRPVSPYGFHKKMAEDICREFHALFHIRTCNVRIFSAYGNGLKKQLLWDLYRKMNESEDKIELFGSGNESRDFIHIDDLVNILELVIEHAGFSGEPINAANGKQEYIRDIVQLVAKEFNWKGTILYSGNNRQGDPLIWEGDIKYITNYGYKQTIPIEIGIKKYIRWIEERKLD